MSRQWRAQFETHKRDRQQEEKNRATQQADDRAQQEQMREHEHTASRPAKLLQINYRLEITTEVDRATLSSTPNTGQAGLNRSPRPMRRLHQISRLEKQPSESPNTTPTSRLA
jgi:hypothetical protein